MERPDRTKYATDMDYIRALERYMCWLEGCKDDPKQDERNKRILANLIYVQDVDENTVVVGIPQPLKCSIDISDASKYKIYFISQRLLELYEALLDYYDPEHYHKITTYRR